MWTELLRTLAPALVGSLTLDKALASRGGDRLTVFLHATRLVTDQEYAAILDALRAGLPGLTVKLRITYPALKEAVLANVASVSGFVTGLLAHDLPGALPYLRSGDSGWRLADGRLRVPVADQLGESYLVKQGADERLAELMKVLFGVQVRVVFEVTGDMERRMAAIREKRAEEEARMAADQELLAAQIAAKEKPAAKQLFGWQPPAPRPPFSPARVETLLQLADD